MFSIGLVRWQIASIPVRSLFIVMGLGVVWMFYARLITLILRAHQIKFIIIGIAALLGVTSSVLVHDPPLAIARQVFEIHIQAAITLLFAVAVILTHGVRWTAKALIICLSISGFIAILQALHVGPAWDLRELAARIQGEGSLKVSFLDERVRPMGLANNPVNLGTHICLLACAAWAYCLRDRGTEIFKQLDWRIVAAVFVCVVFSMASENRSPILGLGLFSMVYAILIGGRIAVATIGGLLILIPLLPIIMASGDAEGMRIASTDDGSAVGRIVLVKHGIRLFLERPMGYGLNFNPTSHWTSSWEDLQTMDNAKIIRNQALHNYFLNCLNKYGVGIIFVGAWAVFYMIRDWRVYLPLIAYVAHIAYHNDGPLQADFLIWYFLPLMTIAFDEFEMEREQQAVALAEEAPPDPHRAAYGPSSG